MTLENKFLNRVCFKKVKLNLYQADKKRINTHI